MMSREKESQEKRCPNELNLKSLQAGLSEAKENYKIQANCLKKLILEANRLKQENLNNPKETKTASITFKKIKVQ